MSLPNCSRKLRGYSQKKLRQPLRPVLSSSGLCIACVKNDTVISGYLNSRKLGRHRSKSILSFVKHRDPMHVEQLNQTIEAECEILWGKRPSLLHECRGNGYNDPCIARMFSALFYVDLLSIPANTTPPFSCELVVTCRLASGSHQNAVIRALLEHHIKVYWEVSGQWQWAYMCDTSAWGRFKARRLLGCQYISRGSTPRCRELELVYSATP